MKKVIIIICCVLLAAAGWGQAILIDSYPTSNGDALLIINTVSRYGAGNSFYADRAFIIDSLVVYCTKTGSPTANTWINIFEHADTSTYGVTSVPQGDSLCKSDNIASSTFSTSAAKVKYSFSGANQIKFTSDYYVWIQVFYTGDGPNYINQQTDITSPSHAGSRVHYIAPDKTYQAFPSRDQIFYVYGKGLIKNIASKPRNDTNKKIAGVAENSIKKVNTLTF